MPNNARNYSNYILNHSNYILNHGPRPHPSIWLQNLAFRKIIFEYIANIGSRYGSAVGVGTRVIRSRIISSEYWGGGEVLIELN